MKSKAHVVIGIGYGDEGKGITTDYLASKLDDPIVVRFSGGQQAGHTVMVDGLKHIHSNFGSGTLRNVPSYFTEHTTFYPVTFVRELDVLTEKGIQPKICFHPLAKITTPFDVFSNRFDTKNLKDGSCGLGVGKTMKRNETPFKLHAIDLLNHKVLFQKLTMIERHYYNLVSNYNLSAEDIKDLENEMVLFVSAVKDIRWNIGGYNRIAEFKNIIFEGSQGVLLDMDHGVFPYVTYANTTSKNVHEILDKLNIEERHCYYITRCYSTRHGSGPFVEGELELINNEEEINVYNEYQKEFKVGPINYDLLNYAMGVDKIYSHRKFTTRNLVVTCLDQLPNFEFDYGALLPKFDKILESYSPDSKDFKIKKEV